jgi:hypothetical protein
MFKASEGLMSRVMQTCFVLMEHTETPRCGGHCSARLAADKDGRTRLNARFVHVKKRKTAFFDEKQLRM